MLKQMLEEHSDDILVEMTQPNFPLKAFLNDKRMEIQNEWIVTMTKLFERITTCTNAGRRLCLVLEEIPGTVYVEGVYNTVRQPDSNTNQLRFGFLQSFLNMSNRLLALSPHLASHLTKIFERIALEFTKIHSNEFVCCTQSNIIINIISMISFFLLLQEFTYTKSLLDEVLARVVEIEKPNRPLHIKPITTTTQFDDDTESDDYRQLPIVPNVQEILWGDRPVLQKNIIDGTYNDSQHYLDVSIMLY